jgi:hypothetical protein
MLEATVRLQHCGWASRELDGVNEGGQARPLKILALTLRMLMQTVIYLATRQSIIRADDVAHLFLSYNATRSFKALVSSPTTQEFAVLRFSILLVALLSRRTTARSTGSGGLWYLMSNFLDSSRQKEATVALLAKIAPRFCQASL